MRYSNQSMCYMEAKKAICVTVEIYFQKSVKSSIKKASVRRILKHEKIFRIRINP